MTWTEALHVALRTLGAITTIVVCWLAVIGACRVYVWSREQRPREG